jgi:hypothetical protein
VPASWQLLYQLDHEVLGQQQDGFVIEGFLVV